MLGEGELRDLLPALVPRGQQEAMARRHLPDRQAWGLEDSADPES